MIETQISDLEDKLVKIDEDMVKFSRDFPKLNELSKEKEQIQKLLLIEKKV